MSGIELELKTKIKTLETKLSEIKRWSRGNNRSRIDSVLVDIESLGKELALEFSDNTDEFSDGIENTPPRPLWRSSWNK